MSETDKAPRPGPRVNLEQPSAARIYDWYLGGAANYAIDREFGQKAVNLWPDAPRVALQNRKWLQRVVTEAVTRGVRQFVDIGAGLPTAGNTHEIARRVAGPDVDLRVVYVDNEPVATAHADIMLSDGGVGDWCGVIQADIRDGERIAAHSESTRLIDWSQPVCVLLCAVLHFVGDDDDPAGIVQGWRERCAAGSWVAVSHLTREDAAARERERVEQFRAAYAETQNPVWLRDRAPIMGWFTGLSLLDEGVVPLSEWRPEFGEHEHDPEPAETRRLGTYSWCGVGVVE